MEGETVAWLGSAGVPGARAAARGAEPRSSLYIEAEQSFAQLIRTDSLDEYVRTHSSVAQEFESALEGALTAAYGLAPENQLNRDAALSASAAAHLFLQRTLYRINRLKLFWYDDLKSYDNERSNYLREIRDRIEAAWQQWELAQLDVSALKLEDVRQALLKRAAEDVRPEPSAGGLYFRDEVTETGYRRLLAIASLDGLVEASQLSRTLGGVSNDIHAMMTRLLVEEYGGGRLQRKHSSFFTVMLAELGMRTEPEGYFELVPWEVLATINHSFLLSERKRFYLRYVGGLLYTETSVPAAFENYRMAAERLGMSEAARGYWDLHIREDERHGRWMLHDVSLPLAEKYPQEAWEILLGYDQQKLLSERAGAAVEQSVRAAEREAAAASVAAHEEAA